MSKSHYKPHSNLLPPKGSLRDLKRLRGPRQRAKYVWMLWRFKVSAFVVIHPILLSVLVSLAAISYPMYIIIDQGKQIKQQSAQNRQLLADIQNGRKEATLVSCGVQNQQIKVNNKQLDVLEGIIVGSVEQSKDLEDLYTRLGLPPYEERLEQAQEIAAPLLALKAPEEDCAARVRRIENDGKGK